MASEARCAPLSHHAPCMGYWWLMVLAWEIGPYCLPIYTSIWYLRPSVWHLRQDVPFCPIMPPCMGYWWPMVLACDMATRANNAGTSHLQLPYALLLLVILLNIAIKTCFILHLPWLLWPCPEHFQGNFVVFCRLTFKWPTTHTFLWSFQVICGGWTVYESSIFEWSKQGNPNKSPTGSIHQICVHLFHGQHEDQIRIWVHIWDFQNWSK